jgi:hypothetical protein
MELYGLFEFAKDRPRVRHRTPQSTRNENLDVVKSLVRRQEAKLPAQQAAVLTPLLQAALRELLRKGEHTHTPAQ